MDSGEFTTEEKTRLTPFFTNMEGDVFGLKLPQEVAGALFSRYSRSSKSLRRVFWEEFLGNTEFALGNVLTSQKSGETQDTLTIEKARQFYDRVLVGYGDDSVAQLGGAHIACENISNVAAKILEDARIGIAPLEKSTRYVRFDQKNRAGEYNFHKESAIMQSSHAQAYLELMGRFFDAYARQMEPMIEFVKNCLPITDLEFKHPRTGEPLAYKEIKDNPELKIWAEKAYRSTVRAQACDVLRSYLPAATRTNVGLFGVGQAFEHLLNKLYSHELIEARALASSIHQELNQLIPSFVKRARANPYLSETWESVRTLAHEILGPIPAEGSDPVTLVDYEEDAEEKIIAAILYPHARHPLTQVRQIIRAMDSAYRRRIMDEYLGRRRHRRDKPGRALEQTYYTFDILGNLGLYRDLHRHRILTQERQDFTVIHGYDTPQEIIEAGFLSVFTQCMEEAARVYQKIHPEFPLEAQYVVPMAYRVRWSVKLNLREAVHIGELRTMPQGHPDYRTIVQEMWRKIEKIHPALAYCAKFIDWKTYRLGRLQSEIRTEYKRSSLT
ncbi:MAG: FAD-dependent thymidylate synthase [Nitrospira sp.]|nr:FAD-dependent thymidylate synthase [Nitrospira sp.]